MGFELRLFGATCEVTGSLYVIRTCTHTVLLECGLVQGGSHTMIFSGDLGYRDAPVSIAGHAQNIRIASHGDRS